MENCKCKNTFVAVRHESGIRLLKCKDCMAYVDEPSSESSDARDTKLNDIKRDIVMSLENCTCLGRDAYGDYINKLTRSLMNKIKEL